MKKFTFTSVLFFILSSVVAQDNIIFKNGDDVKGKVLEVGDELIKFKPADNPDGPTYSYKKSEIFLIKYENGKKDLFNEKQNLNNKSSIYTSPVPNEKSGESVFSVILRTGWDYSHHHEKSFQYTAYPNYAPYNTYFAVTQNDFFIDVLAGKRRKHYQFGGGISIYFKDLKTHNSNFDYYNSWIDLHTDSKGMGIGLVFSNKVYLIDKKFSPFIMGDASLLFDNVVHIDDGYQNYYPYSDYYYTNDNTHVKFTLGAGVELKTAKKYKIQLELGVKFIPGSDDRYEWSEFHTGLSFVF